MKKLFVMVLVVALLMSAVPAAYCGPSNQVLQGTEVRLTLLTHLNSSTSREGDPFVAIVAEPVLLGNQLLLPAGTRVNGLVGTIAPARHFSLIKGESYMNLTFRSLEMDSRIISAQMSILSIEQPREEGNGKLRKDVKIEEGQVVQEKHDIKGDVVAATIGTGGGTLIGAVFSHVVRGFGIGLAGSAAYVVSRKGKDVEIPVRSSILVRMESTITVPAMSASNATY